MCSDRMTDFVVHFGDAPDYMPVLGNVVLSVGGEFVEFGGSNPTSDTTEG